MPDQPNFPPPPPFRPPPGSTPPPYYPPAMPPMMLAPQPRVGGFARAIFTTLALTIFGGSLTLNLYLLIARGVFSSSDIEKTTLTEGDSKSVIAVVSIQGEIGDSTVTEFESVLKLVAADPDVKAIQLRIDSPGGGVTASDEIYADVQRFKKEKHIPVVVSMGALATSGGYYIACAADKIVAQRTTWTGNIGVLLPRINLAKFGEKYGIEDATLKSTGADFKDAGSLFKHDTPEQTAYWQNLADEAFAVFKQVVRDGRGLDAATVDRIANGKVYSGQEAANLKLVDVVGYDQDAIDLAITLAGLKNTNVKVVKYERSHSVFESLGGASRQSSQLAKVQGGPASITFDSAAVREWLTPKPMYLWSGQ